MGDSVRFEVRMSDEDALMWNIEKDPVLRSTIVAVAILDRMPSWERLRTRFDWATLVVPRLRQRVASPPLRLGPPRWVVDADFDLDYHLRRGRLPEPGDLRTLLDSVAPSAMAGFDRARPLWEFTVLDGLDGGRAAVVMKVHHSVTDGIGGIDLLTRLVDLEPHADDPSDWPAAPAADHPGALGLVTDALAHSRRRWTGIAARTPGAVVGACGASLADPVAAAHTAVDAGRSIAKTLAPATAPLSTVMCRRSLGRHLDVIDLALDDLRRAAKAAEGSLNDAFLAGVVGGLARYHRRHGHPAEWLRVNLPISIRVAGDSSVGNHFVPARFAVPAFIDDPATRMAAVGRLVREWRAEPALQLTGALAGILNRLPTATTTALFGSMLKCVDFTASNVPGAPVPLWIAGAGIERLFAFGPPSGSAINVTLVSHVDRCCVGVVADTAAVPDPTTMLADLRAGFDEVLALG